MWGNEGAKSLSRVTLTIRFVNNGRKMVKNIGCDSRTTVVDLNGSTHNIAETWPLHSGWRLRTESSNYSYYTSVSTLYDLPIFTSWLYRSSHQKLTTIRFRICRYCHFRNSRTCDVSRVQLGLTKVGFKTCNTQHLLFITPELKRIYRNTLLFYTT